MVYGNFKTILLEKGRCYFHHEGQPCAVFPVNECFLPGHYYCLVREIANKVYYIHRIVNKDLIDDPKDDMCDTDKIVKLYRENRCPFEVFPYKYQHRKY